MLRVETKKLQALVKTVMTGIHPTANQYSACIKVEANSEQIMLKSVSGNNSGAIVTWDEIKSNDEMKLDFVVEAGLFSQVVSKISSEFIDMELNGFTLAIRGGNVKLSVPNRNIEWPELPPIKENAVAFTVGSEQISECMDAIAEEDAHNVTLNSLCLNVGTEGVETYALDGHRISYRGEMKGQPVVHTMIGKTFLMDVLKIRSGNIEFITDEHTIMVKGERVLLFGVKSSGIVFNTEGYKNPSGDIRLKISRSALINALEVALLLKEEQGPKKPVILQLFKGAEVLTVSSKKTTGTVQTTIPVKYEAGTQVHKNLLYGFNGKYLLEALKSIKDEEILITLDTNTKSPIYITGAGYEELLLPVLVSRA